LGFEIVSLHALETEQRVIERAIKVIFTDVSRYERAAFIDRSPENCITADANTWTARALPLLSPYQQFSFSYFTYFA